ncbi:MAG: L-aspartate oxidase [Nitrospirota bacterium]
MSQYFHQTTDFLVIGSGVAGIRAALSASRYGRVVILNKGDLHESASQKAQGGVAAALNEEESDIESHYQDTVDAGHGLCNPEAVRILVEEGPKRILELIEWGARFDKIGSQFATALEGAHSKGRILRAKGDATGAELIRTLVERAKGNSNLTLLPSHFAIDLIVEDGVCRGVFVLDPAGMIYPFFARGVVLASGGVGQVFARTTNPAVATGDGIAMALRAGATVSDMEFIQFHPTALFLPNGVPFLLSEAMRGEGASLCNAKRKRFMSAYHPDAELASRDIVTRAIWNEMRRGEAIYLDITHLNADFVRERFPTIDKTCLEWGIDITRDLIPIAPAAHYMMGGVKTDLSGRTNIKQLWAAGEVAATGVHGANRLASNALLEGLVFGARVGEDLKEAQPYLLSPQLKPLGQENRPPSPENKAYEIVQAQMKACMWNDVGIIRSCASLDRAVKQLKAFEWVFSISCGSRLALETRNLLMVSAALILAAKTRKESVGAHFLENAPIGQTPFSPDHFSFNWETIQKEILSES